MCGLYRQAAELAANGERVISCDEMTGVQALERKHPGLPLRPGKIERREFEYIRHGTRSFILNLDVARGRVVSPSSGPTRNCTRATERTNSACRCSWPAGSSKRG